MTVRVTLLKKWRAFNVCLSRANVIERDTYSISTTSNTAKRVVTRKQEEESTLSDFTAWRSRYSSTFHRLQMDDPDINPVLQQKEE